MILQYFTSMSSSIFTCRKKSAAALEKTFLVEWDNNVAYWCIFMLPCLAVRTDESLSIF